MAESGAISGDEALSSERQLWFALAAALFLHFLLAVIGQINFRNVTPLNAPPTINVRLVPPTSLPPKGEMEAPRVQPQPPEPIVEPAPEIAPIPEPHITPEPAPTPQSALNSPPVTLTAPPILNSERGTTRGAFPAQDAGKDYVPSQWALEPPLSDQNLKGIGLLDDAECLRALSEDCAALRKEVFAEYELTEMEKVWTEQRADTGMPSEFYGLSEREIRLKVGSKIAGENGFMILPGIGIDGSLWDMMHGVKKTCQMKRGINSEGRYDVVRVCPESLPAARDRKYYIPPKE